jgi:CRP-like cAMP-binding protein
MTGNYIKLYAASEKADSAFLLAEGSVYFYLSNVDKYAISGKNLIIGSTEIIMNHMLGDNTGRIETAAADGGSTMKKIPAEKFVDGLRTYSFALNASMVLAKQVLLTGKILQKNMSDLESGEKKIREYALAYHAIMSRLHQEYEKRKLPWLKDLVDEFRENLTYKRGEALFKSIEPAHVSPASAISDMDAEYQRGAVICEENTPGSEMYILRSGSVDVIVGGSRINTIDEPGTVIGESSLFLGMPRAATLKAKNSVIITKITKEHLKDFAEKQEDFFSGIVASLARRHYSNVTRIASVNKSIIEQYLDREGSGVDKQAALARRTQRDLGALRNRVEDVIREKKADFLADVVSEI